jgi:hypothetical protein
MLAHTIGLVLFHYDFAADGVLEDFAALMPFELAGCVSNPTGVDGGRFGNFGVAVAMITADDARFETEAFDGIAGMSPDEADAALMRCYDNLRRDEKPRFIITFLSPQGNYALDNVMHAVNSAADPSLLCGMQVFNIYETQNANYTFAKGRLAASGCVLVGFYGDAAPDFDINVNYYQSLLSREIYTAEGVITDGGEAVIREIDGIPALDYLHERGIITGTAGGAAEFATIPLIIAFTHGGKAPCMLLGAAEGTKHIRTAREIESGFKVSFCLPDEEGAAANVSAAFDIITEKGYNDILFFCSAAQAWAMSANNLSLLEEIERRAAEYGEKTGTPLKYMVAYTGGELCPIRDDVHKAAEMLEDSGMANMVHNFSLSLCAFSRADTRVQ